MHCNWPQFNWVEEANNTASVQWSVTLWTRILRHNTSEVCMATLRISVKIMIDPIRIHILGGLFQSSFLPPQKKICQFRIVYTGRKNSMCLGHMAIETCQEGILAKNSSRSGVSCNYTRHTRSWLLSFLSVMKRAIGFPLFHTFETTLYSESQVIMCGKLNIPSDQCQ